MARPRTWIATLALTAAGIAGCTTQSQDTPPLTGPSEFGTSITLAVNPDVLRQDGVSQSLVTITARNQNGQPLPNLPVRAEITVNGIIADFGTLSAKNLVTDASGKATLVYTAPASPPFSSDPGTIVQIAVTPSGTDFGNAMARVVSIRLVPPGVVVPPGSLSAVFTFTPTAPTEDTDVLFDATGSIAANPNITIASYSWNFGDGRTGSGRQVAHSFDAGNFTVTLTIADAIGRTGTSTKVVTVASLGKPTADFLSSPVPPRINQPVHFNGSVSSAVAPHTIVSYAWDFGDGVQQTTGSPFIDHTFTTVTSYVVTLVVTDDTGKKSAAKAYVLTLVP